MRGRKEPTLALAAISFISLIFRPSSAYTQSTRDVVISEIAWMGTTTASADEWIELYNNNTGSAIDLTSCTLDAADGTATITLAGTIPAGG